MNPTFFQVFAVGISLILTIFALLFIGNVLIDNYDNITKWLFSFSITKRKTETEKASIEREEILDKRAADIMRETGVNSSVAIYQAVEEYQKDMQEASGRKPSESAINRANRGY